MEKDSYPTILSDSISLSEGLWFFVHLCGIFRQKPIKPPMSFASLRLIV